MLYMVRFRVLTGMIARVKEAMLDLEDDMLV